MSHYSEAEIEILQRRDARTPEVFLTRVRPLVYLACPYSHPSEKMKDIRFTQVTRACAWLMREYNWNVFSPITHSHPLHAIAGLRGDWTFWKKIDTEFIELSHTLVVFCIPGWRVSTGVQEEIIIAKRLNTPVKYLHYLGPDNYLLNSNP